MKYKVLYMANSQIVEFCIVFILEEATDAKILTQVASDLGMDEREITIMNWYPYN